MAKLAGKKKKYVTLMFVPHDEHQVYSLRISSITLLFLGFICLIAIGASSFIMTRHVNYELTRRANIQLTEKNAYFVQELARTHEAFQRVAKIEDELRAMLKMKNKNELLQFTGEGGPSPVDQVNLMKNLNNRATLTPNEFASSLTFLRKDAQEKIESYQELKKYIATQRSLLASTPADWPVRGWITSRFGMRNSPFFEGTTFHQGLDIANEEGTSIKAPADGVITYTGWEGGYGKLIVVDHGYGFSTRYGHCQRILVNIGQRVRRGQVIGFIGSTGRSTAPHLHYEIRTNGVPVDPLKYLKK
ncbi:M23 family metallopeptidase [candidate division FCPU426 bacterium]|nr:M23 family metallopeptidase [candidate division FCPU426 bacterium]